MSPFRYPTLFISHGTPMLAFGDDPVQSDLERFAASFPKPKAIVILSAHSVSTDSIHVLSTKQNRAMHDYAGFPDELYNLQYPCPGDPELAARVGQRFTEAGFTVNLDRDAPLDHGIWIPLMHLYPKGDVPVVRISLPVHLIPAQILKMGHTLASLREQGILLAATGGAVHNLQNLKWSEKRGAGAEWANLFEEWLVEALKRKDVDALLTVEEHPLYALAHPTPEHFFPIYFTVGAALPGDQLQIIHQGIEYDSLSMLSFGLNDESTHSFH